MPLLRKELQMDTVVLQGLNLSLRDIADLGRCLATAGSDPGSAGVTARYVRINLLANDNPDGHFRTGICFISAGWQPVR